MGVSDFLEPLGGINTTPWAAFHRVAYFADGAVTVDASTEVDTEFKIGATYIKLDALPPGFYAGVAGTGEAEDWDPADGHADAGDPAVGVGRRLILGPGSLDYEIEVARMGIAGADDELYLYLRDPLTIDIPDGADVGLPDSPVFSVSDYPSNDIQVVAVAYDEDERGTAVNGGAMGLTLEIQGSMERDAGFHDITGLALPGDVDLANPVVGSPRVTSGAIVLPNLPYFKVKKPSAGTAGAYFSLYFIRRVLE